MIAAPRRRWQKVRHYRPRHTPRLRPLQQTDIYAYRAGVTAARNLAKFFPEWYTEHIAPYPATFTTLLGCTRAWMIKAAEIIDLMELGEAYFYDEYIGKPAERAFEATIANYTDADAQQVLAEYGIHGQNIYDFWPTVYGIPGDVPEWLGDDNVLALVLLTMAKDTRWGLAWHNPDELWERCIDDKQLLALQTQLPRFAADARLGSLATNLNYDHPDFANINIGGVLTYIYQIGDNQFIYLNDEMVWEMTDSGLDWEMPIEDIENLARLQEQAESYLDSYFAIRKHIGTEPTNIIQFAQYLIKQHATLPGNIPDPDIQSQEETNIIDMRGTS
jgi:hypothetical protein